MPEKKAIIRLLRHYWKKRPTPSVNKKYDWLNNNDITTTKWQEIIPKSEFYFFVPRDEKLLELYERSPKITDIFLVNSVGIVTARDRLTIQFTPEKVFTFIFHSTISPPLIWSKMRLFENCLENHCWVSNKTISKRAWFFWKWHSNGQFQLFWSFFLNSKFRNHFSKQQDFISLEVQKRFSRSCWTYQNGHLFWSIAIFLDWLSEFMQIEREKHKWRSICFLILAEY